MRDREPRLPRLVRVNQLVERRGVIAVAGARLLPGPFSEFNMLAGLTLLKRAGLRDRHGHRLRAEGFRLVGPWCARLLAASCASRVAAARSRVTATARVRP